MDARGIIDKILKTKSLKLKDQNELAMRCQIIPNTLTVAIGRNTLSDEIVTKIHDNLGVSKEFLKEGKEPVLDENPTHEEKTANNNGTQEYMDKELLKVLTENNEHLRKTQETILDRNEILSKDEMKLREKVMDNFLELAKEISATKDVLLADKDKLIALLERELKELRHRDRGKGGDSLHSTQNAQ